MQGTSAVESDVIGDVDERADRPQANRSEPLLHPFRRGAVGHAADEPECEGRAEMLVLGREIETDAGRAIERAFIRFRRRRLELSKSRRGEIARDASDAGGVGTVRRHRDIDDRIVEPGEARVRNADRRVRGQFDNALMVVAKLELGGRAQHAVQFDAADDALGEGELLAGNVGSDGREHAFHAGARVRRAADDLHRLAACVDDADPQPVGVGMLIGFNDGSDNEAVVLLARVLDQLDLKADAGQRIDDLGQRSRCVEVVFQPGEGEFHNRDLLRGLAIRRIASLSFSLLSRRSIIASASLALVTISIVCWREKRRPRRVSIGSGLGSRL